MFAKWAHARPLRHASRKLLYSQGCRRCAQRASPHEESGSVREQGGFVDLSQRVEARQELRLTTELRQGIEIMQMSAVELSDYVKQRVEENPSLDDDDWLYPQHPYEADTYTRTVSTDEQVIAQMPGDDAEQREKIFKQLKDQGLEAEGRKFALREAALGWLVNNSRVSFK